jgi:hypothetical protein
MGTLSIVSITASSAAVNLDTVNSGGAPDDWAEWGITANLTPDNRRNGGGSTISVALSGGGSTSNNTGDARTVSWTNGTPTASSSNTDCIFNSSFTRSLGLSFSLPADTNVRTAWFYVGAYNNTCTYVINASLSDSSASSVSDTTHFLGSTTAFNPYVIIFQYSANSPGQTLTVTLTNPASGTPQTVTLQGVAVAKTGSGTPISIAWVT